MLQVWGYSPEGLSFETNCNCIPIIYRNHVQAASVMQGKYAFFISGHFGRYVNKEKDYTKWLDDIKLPEKIYTDVVDEKCIVVVDDTTEGLDKEEIYWTLYWFAKHNQLNQNNFVFSTSNLAFPDLDFCEVYRDNFVLEYCSYMIIDKDPEFIQPIKDNRGQWEYPFINLGGEPRPHRIAYHNMIRNHFPDSGISTINQGFRYKYIDADYTPETSPYEDPNQSTPFIWHMVNPNHFIHIPVASVVETFIDKTFITEKAFKNLVYPQPFVLVSAYKTISRLRDLGFRVYDEYVDHSYDLIEDNDERMAAAFESFKRLIAGRVDFPLEWEIIEHNRNVARNLTIAEEFIAYLYHKLHH